MCGRGRSQCHTYRIAIYCRSLRVKDIHGFYLRRIRWLSDNSVFLLALSHRLSILNTRTGREACGQHLIAQIEAMHRVNELPFRRSRPIHLRLNQRQKILLH
jgi:hypothetical protein